MVNTEIRLIIFFAPGYGEVPYSQQNKTWSWLWLRSWAPYSKSRLKWKKLGKTTGEGNGTHSSTLAWKIPWTEEPGRLQPMGSLRVGHDWATSLSLFTFMHWRRRWQPTPVFLAGESQGRRSLVGCRLWGHTESDTTEATQQQQQQGKSLGHSSMTKIKSVMIIQWRWWIDWKD